MDTTNLDFVYDTALGVIDNAEYFAKQYVVEQVLAMWCVKVWSGYSSRKVITERLRDPQDISIIVSDTKLSVIINATGQHSYCAAENIIRYEDMVADFENLLACLDFAIARAVCN